MPNAYAMKYGMSNTSTLPRTSHVLITPDRIVRLIKIYPHFRGDLNNCRGSPFTSTFVLFVLFVLIVLLVLVVSYQDLLPLLPPRIKPSSNPHLTLI